MIKKNYITAGLFFILLIMVFLVKITGRGNTKMLAIESVPIHTSGGWGYDILIDHKIFIHQQYIPAVMGKKEFSSKNDAMKTAGLVIEKLKQRIHPAITRQDLLALKISL